MKKTPDTEHDAICIDPPSTITAATATPTATTTATTTATPTATATAAAATTTSTATTTAARPLLITPLAAVLPLLTSGSQSALQHQVPGYGYGYGQG